MAMPAPPDDFVSRSTAREARTIMARKSGISVLPRVRFWLYFRSRSTARRARTIMARKSASSVLPKVTFWLYFLNSIRTGVNPTLTGQRAKMGRSLFFNNVGRWVS